MERVELEAQAHIGDHVCCCRILDSRGEGLVRMHSSW